MKKLFIFLLLSMPVLLSSCDRTDDGYDPTGESKTYELKAVSDPAIMGMATFEKNRDGSTTITLSLDGVATGMHPAHIHANAAAEGGPIVIDLTQVNDSGTSITHVSAFNTGMSITYDELLNFDGYINVHESADNLGTLIAQGDIGANELTGNTKEYALGPVSDPNIMGTALFSERKDGSTLIALDLEGTSAGNSHPSHIHMNTAAEGGAIVIDLTAVDGATGMSATQVEAFNDDSPVTYADLLDYDGYINVHASASDLGTLLAQGDVGQNEMTGESATYILREVSNPAINGVASFKARSNGETLVILELNGTVAGGLHPAHIHAGSVAEAPGAIVIDLTSVDGATGISKTNVAAYNDDTAINYTEMIAIDGYVNVHLSANNLGVLIAQGNVGSNVQ